MPPNSSAWSLGGPGLWPAVMGAALCGLVAALTGGPWGTAVLAATLAAVVAGVLRPAALLPLIAFATVGIPPYVGWLLPGGLFFNVQRGVIYGAAVGLILWTMSEARREHARPEGSTLGGMARAAIASLMVGWLLAPLVGLAHGGGNAFRALNAALYQALPLWVGLRFASEYGQRRTIQVVFGLLIVYTAPYWLYELEFAKSAFHSYAPPIPGVLTGSDLLTRGGEVRVQATFGHPLAFDQFLVVALPMAASLVLVRRLRVIGLLAVCTGVTALWATHSRSPWVALIGGVIGTIVLRRPRLGAIAAIGVVLAFVFTPLGNAVGPYALGARAKALAAARFSQSNEAEFSAASRVFLTVSSVRAISQHPWIGYGVNAIGTSAGIPSVDDYFLVLPLEVGIAVGGPILVGMILMWISVARRQLVGPETEFAAVAIGAYLVQLLFVGLHDTLPLLFLVGGTMSEDPRRATPPAALIGKHAEEG